MSDHYDFASLARPEAIALEASDMTLMTLSAESAKAPAGQEDMYNRYFAGLRRAAACNAGDRAAMDVWEMWRDTSDPWQVITKEDAHHHWMKSELLPAALRHLSSLEISDMSEAFCRSFDERMWELVQNQAMDGSDPWGDGHE